MTRAELDEEITLLRSQAMAARKIADSLDERADYLRTLLAQQSTEELNFCLPEKEKR